MQSAEDDIQMIFQLLALNFVPDPPQFLQPFTPKIIVFEDKKPKRFLFKEVPAEPNKKYILNVHSQTITRIGISVDESKPKMYHFQGHKAIVIHDQPWKELIVIVQVDKIGPFSTVKIIL